MKSHVNCLCLLFLLTGLYFPSALFSQEQDQVPEDAMQPSLPTPEPIPESSNVESFGPSTPGIDDIRDGDQVTMPQSEMGRSGGPDIYTVVKGDTLWDICATLLGDPFYWPQLWSLNRYIKNPHLIFPGQTIRFDEGSENTLPRMTIGEDDPSPDTTASSSEAREEEFIQDYSIVQNKGTIRLRTFGYVAEKRPDYIGEVTHSQEPKRLLTYGDIVYLKLKNNQSPKVGDRFRVIEPVKTLKGRKGKVGQLVHKLAVVKVQRVLEKTVEARITDAHSSIKRGQKLIAYQDDLVELKPFEKKMDLDARILVDENSKILISNNEYIFIDRGSKQGIEVGQRLVVTKQGDALYPGNDQDFPELMKGRLVVIESNPNTATAYVIEITGALQEGDTIRSYIE